MDQRRIDELINAPAEGLNVEVKRWISPDNSEGLSTIVKACFALRNRNGGFLLIGFDNDTLLPHNDNRPSDVKREFNLDKIQGMVSRYASEVFEVFIEFGQREGLEYPVIAIPEGVTAPVAAKRDLKGGAGGKPLIREGDVYFRTLLSNGTPSSARARPSDWPDIMAICFDNREADIGRFFRRHLSGGSIESLINALSDLREGTSTPVSTLADRAKALLTEGEKRRLKAIERRDLSPEQAALTQNAAWSIGLAIDPPHSDALPDQSFLRTALAANPQYTGWPIWLDSRGFDAESRPKVVEKGWEALIISPTGWFKHADFMRLDPTGEFYIWCPLRDDLTETVTPGTALDVILVIIQVAEAIAVGLSISKALGWQSGATLGFAFRWTGLNGRELASWANPLVSIMPWNRAEDSSVDTYVEVPFDTPLSAIAPFVDLATRDLFIAFNGYTLPINATEHWTQRLIERRL